jgi:acyl-CoA reductase-like NAD-dependent aldehyde dehydrogenase
LTSTRSQRTSPQRRPGTGQTCVCYNRIYIHASIYGAVCKKVQEYLKEIVIGKGRDEGRVMGSMINRASR